VLEVRRILAGGQSAALAGAIVELRGNVMAVWRSAVQKSRPSLAALEQAEALRAERHAAMYASDWMTHLLSHASQIPPEEVVAVHAERAVDPTGMQDACGELSDNSSLFHIQEGQNCNDSPVSDVLHDDITAVVDFTVDEVAAPVGRNLPK
jgi:hypothetical protein